MTKKKIIKPMNEQQAIETLQSSIDALEDTVDICSTGLKITNTESLASILKKSIHNIKKVKGFLEQSFRIY